MKIIVIGSGGREHALAWKLLQSPQVEQVFCIPGNGGTAILPQCENIPISMEDFAEISRFAQENRRRFGGCRAEYPLSLGITDHLLRQEIAVFAPQHKPALN
ncbi:MAG UNVERIFIED_CONTAM: hypothetical protein LVR29_12560 [Microcystis novacekii LVE1205-3]|jgi:phosphoribosylamine--glycine ligase